MNENKIYDVILYICNEVPPFKNGALKINKLVWFIESEYYRLHNATITGVKFAAIDHGPVINDYKLYFNHMQKKRLIKLNKEDHNSWHFTPLKQSILSTLNDSEKLIVKDIVEKMKELNADALEELSHKDAYEITVGESHGGMGQIIDMDLVLLESSPLDNDADMKEIPQGLEESTKIVEKHNIETI
jgi:uncharacterized phage-associated protein